MADLKMYSDQANLTIDQLLAGGGNTYMKETIAVIDGLSQL
jgi:hypothetical protein